MDEADEKGYGSRSKYLYELIQEARAARQEGFLAYSQNESKVEALTSLNGIGVPVASAILLFIDKDQFTVIDKRAWNVLQEAGYLSQSLSEDPTVDEYLLYLGACWALANEYDVSLRTLDMALWVLDIEGKSTAGD